MPRVRDQSMEVKFQAGEAPRPVAAGRAVDVLNSLLRGELAAIETYRQAIEKDGPDAASLASLRDEHADSATRLRQRIVALSGTPDTAGGAWSGLAKAIEGAAKLLGKSAALAALKTGEEYGLRAYEDALAGGDLDAPSADLAANTLLPRQAAHAGTLDRLIHAKTA